MSQAQLSVETFRTAYRALIEELLRLADPDPRARLGLEQALLRSPLDVPRELAVSPRLAALERQFVDLVRAPVQASRDALTEIARAVIREVTRAHEPTTGSGGTESARPPGWAHAKPPTRDGGGGAAGGAPGGGGGGGGRRGGLLGARQPARAAPPAAAAPVAPPRPPAPAPPPAAAQQKQQQQQPEARYMSAAIANHDAAQPLAVAKDYLLEVWVALEKQGDAAVKIPDANVLFRPDEEVVDLMIQVTSDDFTVAQDAMPLKLPRRGPSAGKARFDVTPTRAGRGTLTIGVHKEGNFLLQMELSYSVGAVAAEPASLQVKGRSLAAAAQLQKRELTLTIEPALNGYRCIVSGATYTRVTLPLTEAQVADAVTAARTAMLSVVGLRDDARGLVFQTGIDIDAASRAKALRILAEAGATLFQRLFFGPAAGPDVRQVGKKLRGLATLPGRRYSFQFMVDRFPVPWGMLYLGDAGDAAALDWDLFLGMRHVVEQIPLQTDMLVDDTVIASDSPALAVSVNFNTSIDAQYELDVVARQRAFWRGLATKAGTRMQLVEGLTRKEILGAFHKPSTDQLTYLYCHAESVEPGAPGGVNASCFVFADDERLTLEEMNRNAPMTDAFPGNPLVFINACESAELRPEFYDGFIPYFMAKGARGVVGTECETPAIFATEWALRFFPRFLDGAPLGEVFLDLRREFQEQHGNPLGLLYNVYCDGDTQVQPGLTL